MFPKPTADPDAAKINAKREENCPLCIPITLNTLSISKSLGHKSIKFEPKFSWEDSNQMREKSHH